MDYKSLKERYTKIVKEKVDILKEDLKEAYGAVKDGLKEAWDNRQKYTEAGPKPPKPTPSQLEETVDSEKPLRESDTEEWKKKVEAEAKKNWKDSIKGEKKYF